jgi:hypothetical protein
VKVAILPGAAHVAVDYGQPIRRGKLDVILVQYDAEDTILGIVHDVVDTRDDFQKMTDPQPSVTARESP